MRIFLPVNILFIELLYICLSVLNILSTIFQFLARKTDRWNGKCIVMKWHGRRNGQWDRAASKDCTVKGNERVVGIRYLVLAFEYHRPRAVFLKGDMTRQVDRIRQSSFEISTRDYLYINIVQDNIVIINVD